MVVEKVPSEIMQAKARKYEELRRQLASIIESRETVRRNIEELRFVLEEIKKLEGVEGLYKLVGFVLVPVKRDALERELEERIAELEAKAAKLAKMEASIREELERIVLELKKYVEAQGGGPVAG